MTVFWNPVGPSNTANPNSTTSQDATVGNPEAGGFGSGIDNRRELNPNARTPANP
jgi:hypothetical protein